MAGSKSNRSGRYGKDTRTDVEMAQQFFGVSFPAGSGSPSLDDAPVVPLGELINQRLSGLMDGEPLLPRRTDPEGERVDECRAMCRGGNPFPLIAAQWPEFVITDPDEAVFFQGSIGDPVDPCLRLDYWQRDILASFFDPTIKEVFVKGCVGAGKGTASSLIFNLAFDVWTDCRIILTSTTYEHARDTIFAEVTKWRERMAHAGPGKTLTEGIYDTPQHRIMVSNPLTGEAFSGKHGEMVIYGFDEASGTRQLLYNNALNQFHKIVALSNPRTQHGWFRAGFKPCRDPDETQTVQGQYGKRRCVTVSGANCANIRHHRCESPMAPRGGLEVAGRHFVEGEPIPPEFYPYIKPLIPNQSDLARYRGLLADPDPREVDVKAHGKFPAEDITKQVILNSWLPYHEAAWHKHLKVHCFGADIAAFHDANVLVAGGEKGVCGIERFVNPTALTDRDHTMKVVAWILRTALEKYGIDLKLSQVPICVDCDGIGKGVGDRLYELGVWVIPFQGNQSSEVDPRRYANLRAEAYGELGRRLDNHGPWGLEPWALPADEFLSEDLTAPEKIYDSSGERFHITPKSRQHGMPEGMLTVKEKIGRSPDTGDAIVYCFHAVRKMNLWSSHMAATQAPLVISPLPAGSANGNGHAEAIGAGAVASRAAEPSAPMNPESQKMMEYLRRQYGGQS
jgi:hypothetical protein